MRVCNNLPQPNPYILVFGGYGRLLHALTPRSAFLYLHTVSSLHPTSFLYLYPLGVQYFIIVQCIYILTDYTAMPACMHTHFQSTTVYHCSKVAAACNTCRQNAHQNRLVHWQTRNQFPNMFADNCLLSNCSQCCRSR